MNEKIERLLKKLEDLNQEGGQWNISHETGQFLYDEIITRQPKIILEIGASNGYSTIWLAMAAKAVGAKVITFEFVPDKVRDLVSNLQKAKLIHYVEIIPDDANKRLKKFEQKVDFVFLDGRKNEYLQQFKLIEPKLNPGAVVMADNAISHKHVMEDFFYYIKNSNDFKTKLKDLGTGLQITDKI